MIDVLRIYLPGDGMMDHAQSGKIPFLTRIQETLPPLGLRVELCEITLEARVASLLRPEFALVLMEPRWHPNMLTLRRAYFWPYWRMEKSADRWEFEVAQTQFDPDALAFDPALKFAHALRKGRFGDVEGRRDTGMIFVPLQGRIATQRSFQAASPIQMLEDVLDRAEGRRVVATLHPNETYSKSEMAALERLKDRYPALDIRTDAADALLPACDFVVTQNSSAALMGFLLNKPAILYGKTDFHHIASNVWDLGVDGAFQAVSTNVPDFAKYMTWFIRDHAIDGTRPAASNRIVNTLRRRGWEF
jgi:hypothetical protein